MILATEVIAMAKEEIRDAVYTRRYIYNFHYHLIWVTKYRNKTFVTEQLSNEMKSILQLVADDNDIVIEKMEVMPDHVHVLISFHLAKRQPVLSRPWKVEVLLSSSGDIQKSDNPNTGVVIYGRQATTWAR